MATRVLIADDDKFNAALLGDVCRAAGLEVILAKNGEEAVTKARAERPDLIVLDRYMPVLDGLEACAALRKDSALASIPAVLLTASDDMEGRLRGLEVGIDSYLVKPFRVGSVVDELTAVLRGDEAHEPGVGSYRALRRALAAEQARADESGRPLACAVLIPSASAPQGEAAAAFVAAHGARLAEALRASDRLFLLGKTELVLLLPGTEGHALDIALERLRVVIGPEADQFSIAAVAYEPGEGGRLVRRAREARSP